MTIAVDFDGTIVEHKYPEIGKEIPFAIETLKRLASEHNKIILWSVREGKLLDDAVEYCRKRGLEFYAVNSNNPENGIQRERRQRKLIADVYIDDRNVGGLPDWGLIYRMISRNMTWEQAMNSMDDDDDEPRDRSRSGLFARLRRGSR
jgi:hypothetical protein